MPSPIRWFSQLSKSDIPVAGGKGANLGELTRANIPVPEGFVVLSSAYFDFLTVNNLRPQIHKLLATCDPNHPDQLHRAATKIQKLMLDSPIPHELSTEIFKSYDRLHTQYHAQSVAIRSSATAEDLPEASFAGQQSSYLNISGEANVVLKVRECWASLFEPRSIFYRAQKHFDHFKVGIAVVVQKMVFSDMSGVMFTVDPVSQDKNQVVIEAIYGLGDYIVQGVVTPDHYVFDKTSHQLVVKHQVDQLVMEQRRTQGVKEVKVPKILQSKPKLSDGDIIKLGLLGTKIQQHYLFPQDIEWAKEGDAMYITQSRPITTLGETKISHSQLAIGNSTLGTPILKGAPASPGLASGTVRLITDFKHLSKVHAGDVMVTDMTTPDYVPAMRKAVAIVTNKGGLTSHAAIISRELGVPCVVGTTSATSALKDGMTITVNGSTGEVFKGSFKSTHSKVLPTMNHEPLTTNHKTATKLFVNLAQPELAAKIAKLPVDGVGLLRAEFMIAQIGTHPKHLIATGHQATFVNQLTEGLLAFAKSFAPRPILYRATDFRTNEYRNLKGGDRYEPHEENPMLGFRGALRYITNPDVFQLELEAIKKVRRTHHLTNLHLMIPFVRTPTELLEVKKIVATSGLVRSSSFHLYMMVELPSNVILLNDFLDVGIDGVSIGSNDLTMLILGADRDNQDIARDFNERDPAVLWALERIVKTCAARRVICSICGQAPSEYPELVEKLVKWGITSISVNPDVISQTRQTIYQAEHDLVSHAHTK